MAIDRPTLQEIIDRIEADIESRTVYPLVRRSVLKVLARVYGGAVHTLYGYLAYQADQIFVNSASGESLDRHAEEYGMGRQIALKAEGYVTVVGVLGTSIPAGTELQSPDGLLYETVSLASLDLASGGIPGSDGMQQVLIRAKTAGAEYNQGADVLFSFTSPLTDVQPTADTLFWIRGGTDRETDAELRARVLRRKQYPPMGGAAHDYVTWMLEFPGVTRAWCFPNYDGDGTVGCAFVMDGESSILSSTIMLPLVKEYLIEHDDPISGLTVGCPATAQAGLRMISLSELPVNFEVILSPNTTTVQAQVQAELEDLILREGGPGETLRLSRIGEAISSAYGEEQHTLVVPGADIVASESQIHVMGSVTFSGSA